LFREHPQGSADSPAGIVGVSVSEATYGGGRSAPIVEFAAIGTAVAELLPNDPRAVPPTPARNCRATRPLSVRRSVTSPDGGWPTKPRSHRQNAARRRFAPGRARRWVASARTPCGAGSRRGARGAGLRRHDAARRRFALSRLRVRVDLSAQCFVSERIASFRHQLRSEIMLRRELVVRAAAQSKVRGDICALLGERLQMMNLQEARLATSLAPRIDIAAIDRNPADTPRVARPSECTCRAGAAALKVGARRESRAGAGF